MDFKIRNMKHETNPSPGDDGRWLDDDERCLYFWHYAHKLTVHRTHCQPKKNLKYCMSMRMEEGKEHQWRREDSNVIWLYGWKKISTYSTIKIEKLWT
jgi:hypothetical protein